MPLNATRNPFQRIKDRLWGFDFFISYHWKSGGAYAVTLAQRLQAKNFDVFLDRADYASGDDWKQVGEIALRNTQRLVLIATREALLESKPVEREVQIFTDCGRQVIPILFGDTFEAADKENSRVLGRMPESKLYIEEVRQALVDGPSESVVARLIQTHGVLRRRNVRALLTMIPAFVVIFFSLFACVSWLNALNSADFARDQAQMAIAERDAAKEAEKTAEMILDVIENKAETDVVIHGVLMEATLVAIKYLEERKSNGVAAKVTNPKLVSLYIAHAWHSDNNHKIDQAIDEYFRALELQNELSAGQPDDPEIQLRQAFLMNNLANCYRNKGDLNRAVEMHRETLLRRQEIYQRFPDVFDARRQVGVSLGNLGDAYLEVGRKEEGMRYVREALAFEEQLWKDYPNNRWVGLNLSNGLSNLSITMQQEGDLAAAIELKRRAYVLRRKLYTDARDGVPSDDRLGLFNFEEKYGKVTYELAALLAVTEPDKPEEVDQLFEESLVILKRLKERNPDNERYGQMFGDAASLQAHWSSRRPQN